MLFWKGVFLTIHAIISRLMMLLCEDQNNNVVERFTFFSMDQLLDVHVVSLSKQLKRPTKKLANPI